MLAVAQRSAPQPCFPEAVRIETILASHVSIQTEHTSCTSRIRRRRRQLAPCLQRRCWKTRLSLSEGGQVDRSANRLRCSKSDHLKAATRISAQLLVTQAGRMPLRRSDAGTNSVSRWSPPRPPPRDFAPITCSCLTFTASRMMWSEANSA